EFFQRRIVIVIAVIIGGSASQVRLGKIGLQLQSPLGQGLSFFATFRRPFERMQNPAFQLRIARNGESKVWIEFDGALVKLLTLFQLFEVLKGTGKVVGLDEGEIGLAVFGGLVFHLRFFAWRQLCPQLSRDLLGEIGLNREDICQLAIVIFSPNVLVVFCVD